MPARDDKENHEHQHRQRKDPAVNVESVEKQRDEARALARALYDTAVELAEDLGELSRINPDLDVDERLPFWLTGVVGAPVTWQRDGV